MARAGIRQGLISPKQLLDEIFGSRGVIATLDVPNHLSTISRWLPNEFSAEKLAYRHTLFPIYAHFVPEDRRQQCMKWMLGESQGAVHLALGIAASRIKTPRFIRYCPGCLIAQHVQQREYFWLREWQVAGIDRCPEHGVLIATRLIRPSIGRHRFVAASPEECPLVRQGNGEPVSDWISYQVRQLLSLPAQRSSSFAQWTGYYRSLACGFGFSRGNAQIDHQAVREKVLQVWPATWLTRYNLMPNGSDGNDADWLRSIFRKHRKSFSYLQHIVVNQALLSDDWEIRKVIEEVCHYPEDNCQSKIPGNTAKNQRYVPDQQAWLDLIVDNSPKQARQNSPALYARLYRNHRDWLLEINHRHADTRSGGRIPRVDWDRRDRETLLTLRQLAIFLSANAHGPRRSRAYYLKMLGNPSTVEKNLRRMPLSTAFLSADVESVAQHQIRRLQNAYDELQNQFDSPPRWRLLRSAKLSEERLTESARIYLEELVSIKHEVQRCRK